ncbi:hypothetical protein MHBO_001777 [Bonamia ostreae]|uniref:Ribosomal RNA-processing protein 7 C-terminal domain-containing protein n=1 Tax=Bonamia ostreae TaxID=126728 RepID=A0ABV2AK91_9EUKA
MAVNILQDFGTSAKINYNGEDKKQNLLFAKISNFVDKIDDQNLCKYLMFLTKGETEKSFLFVNVPTYFNKSNLLQFFSNFGDIHKIQFFDENDINSNWNIKENNKLLCKLNAIVVIYENEPNLNRKINFKFSNDKKFGIEKMVFEYSSKCKPESELREELENLINGNKNLVKHKNLPKHKKIEKDFGEYSKTRINKGLYEQTVSKYKDVSAKNILKKKFEEDKTKLEKKRKKVNF